MQQLDGIVQPSQETLKQLSVEWRRTECRVAEKGRHALFARPRNGHSMLRGVFAVIAERHDNEVSLLIAIARWPVQTWGLYNASLRPPGLPREIDRVLRDAARCDNINSQQVTS